MGTSVKRLRDLRLVLVDDDSSFTLMWSRIFEADGHTVVRCHDMQSACTAIADGCDCVITDLQMRDVSGLDLIRAANHPAGPVLILMTGDDSPDLRSQAFDAGAACVFHKGEDTALVVSTVEALCGAICQPVMRYKTGEFSLGSALA